MWRVAEGLKVNPPELENLGVSILILYFFFFLEGLKKIIKY